VAAALSWSPRNAMVVGVCRLTFSLPGNASLKGKRSIVRRIVDRTRSKFNSAVAEVSDMDAHRRAVIGVAVVSNDGRHANAMLDQISAFMVSLTEAVLTDRSLDILHTDGEPAPLSAALMGAGLPWPDQELDDDED
jgi:uncharacterized protein YlxP (DUF503 family)